MKPKEFRDDPEVCADGEIKRTLARALKLCNVADIQTLKPAELISLQGVLQHGTCFGHWETPKAWHPGAPCSILSIDIVGRINTFLEHMLGSEGLQDIRQDVLFCRLLEDALLSTTRYLVLLRCGPASLRPLGAPMKPSNIAHLAYQYLPQASAFSLLNAIKGDESALTYSAASFAHFSRLTEEDFIQLATGSIRRRSLCQELGRMRYLASRKLWDDTPPQPSVITHAVGEVHATHIRNIKNDANPPQEIQPHLPFPDEWVSQMGRSSVWLINEVGTSLIQCLQGIKRIWKEAASSYLSPTRISARCVAFLAEFRWLDSRGDEILGTSLPVVSWRAERLSNDRSEGFIWPPRTFEDVTLLTSALQSAHMFLTGIATAPRTTEAITLERSCVVVDKDGHAYQQGRTYKLVRIVDGAVRDWTLPELAVKALTQQAELISIYERLSPMSNIVDPDSITPGTHLWGRIGYHTPRTELMGIGGPNDLLRNFAELLEMDTNPGGQPIRYHRFRKTLARLAALAITSAPKVLMDVFGHKSIEMTLYYILTDKSLTTEIDTVARELRVLRCTTVLNEVIEKEDRLAAFQKASGERYTSIAGHSTLGGPAAARIERAVKLAREEVHMRCEDWNATDTLDLANRMTMEGRCWELVRPGVLCIKTVDQVGRCTGKKGTTDASNCKTHCDHHLEESWRRRDVDQCIEQAVAFYETELSHGRDLVASQWAGQIRSHIGIFPELMAKWSAHPTVAAILAEEPQ